MYLWYECTGIVPVPTTGAASDGQTFLGTSRYSSGVSYRHTSTQVRTYRYRQTEHTISGESKLKYALVNRACVACGFVVYIRADILM